MRKLVDNNLIKLIDTMSESPYEEYYFGNTPMFGFQIAQGGIEKNQNYMDVYFEGKIEPYTHLNLSNIDNLVNIENLGGYAIRIHLPEIITEPFEISSACYFENEPKDVSIQIMFPNTDAILPLCLTFNEKTAAIKQWSSTPTDTYVSLSKPDSYTSQEEGWAFGYKHGMFYLTMNSL